MFEQEGGGRQYELSYSVVKLIGEYLVEIK